MVNDNVDDSLLKCELRNVLDYEIFPGPILCIVYEYLMGHLFVIFSNDELFVFNAWTLEALRKKPIDPPLIQEYAVVYWKRRWRFILYKIWYARINIETMCENKRRISVSPDASASDSWWLSRQRAR